jgi:hypothetical protein
VAEAHLSTVVRTLRCQATWRAGDGYGFTANALVRCDLLADGGLVVRMARVVEVLTLGLSTRRRRHLAPDTVLHVVLRPGSFDFVDAGTRRTTVSVSMYSPRKCRVLRAFLEEHGYQTVDF